MARDFVTCDRGHFYDPEKYQACPYCYPGGAAAAGGRDLDATVPLEVGQQGPQYGGDDATATAPMEAVGDFTSTAPIAGEAKAEVKAENKGQAQIMDDEKTVPFEFKAGEDGKSFEPVVGWLVCVKGNDIGSSYTLKSGKNFIGRDAASSDVAIKGDKAISRERHGIVTFDPKAGRFFAQPGTSSQLYYLNDNVVLQVMELKDRDRISIGNSELMFVALCNDSFSWTEKED